AQIIIRHCSATLSGSRCLNMRRPATLVALLVLVGAASSPGSPWQNSSHGLRDTEQCATETPRHRESLGCLSVSVPLWPMAPCLASRLRLSPRPAGRADTSDRLTRTVHLTPGTPIRVDATIADLTIAGSNRTDVLVDIVRHAPSAADLAKYPAVVDLRPDALRISAV